MDNKTQGTDSTKKLGELIKGIKIAMMTTIEDDGSLRSRPMATQQVEFDGDLWFFTKEHSGKTEELSHDRRVNLSYADPNDNRYVSVSGTAQLVKDQQKNKELWNPLFKAWFPDGENDPELALLKISVEQAEYWDSKANKLIQLAGFVKAAVTGEPAKGGENEKLNFHPAQQDQATFRA